MQSLDINVLIIEDNPADIDLIKEYLEDSNHNFSINSTDKLGLAEILVSEHKFDIILLDLSLTDSIGLETITKVQAFSSNIPIIVLTGSDYDEIAIECVNLGAQAFLVKKELSTRYLERAILCSLNKTKKVKKEIDGLIHSEHTEILNKNIEWLENFIKNSPN